MKSISPELLALLESKESFGKCDLYTITLVDGTVVRTTDADINVPWGGFTFLSDAPALKRSKVKVVVGIEVDEMDLTILSPQVAVNGFTYTTAARLGILDWARVLVETAYVEKWPSTPLEPLNVVGVIHTFYGVVADADPGRSEIRLKVKSALDLLAVQFPRNVYQSTCLHTLYDSGCGVSRSAFTVSSTVTGTSTQTQITTGLSQPAGYFDQGVVVFNSGPLAGLRRTVKSYASGTFVFNNPLPIAPAAGVTVSAYPGCNKNKSTCSAKFSNLSRFKGFPYIPVPETTF